MRVLDFVVNKQNISKAPDCDFSGLIMGSSGYLQARFTFSPEWAGYRKAAVFTCRTGKYPVLVKGCVCNVPDEVAACSSFKVQVVGKRGDEVLPSGPVTVIQRRH